MFINYATGEVILKIVYYGTGLCGKTTNLAYIHERTAEGQRSKLLSLATQTDRTLFFDLLPVEVGTIAGMKIRLQLYTVPGQVFYNATRKTVLKGADGVVFVADSQGPLLAANLEAMKNLEENLESLDQPVRDTPLVIQYNKRDLPNTLPLDVLERELNPRGVPSIQAAALEGIGVTETLKAITRIVLKRMPFAPDEDAAPRRAAAPAPALEIEEPPEGIAAHDPLGLEDEPGVEAPAEVVEPAVAPGEDELGELVLDVDEPVTTSGDGIGEEAAALAAEDEAAEAPAADASALALPEAEDLDADDVDVHMLDAPVDLQTDDLDMDALPAVELGRGDEPADDGSAGEADLPAEEAPGVEEAPAEPEPEPEPEPEEPPFDEEIPPSLPGSFDLEETPATDDVLSNDDTPSAPMRSPIRDATTFAITDEMVAEPPLPDAATYEDTGEEPTAPPSAAGEDEEPIVVPEAIESALPEIELDGDEFDEPLPIAEIGEPPDPMPEPPAGPEIARDEQLLVLPGEPADDAGAGADAADLAAPAGDAAIPIPHVEETLAEVPASASPEEAPPAGIAEIAWAGEAPAGAQREEPSSEAAGAGGDAPPAPVEPALEVPVELVEPDAAPPHDERPSGAEPAPATPAPPAVERDDPGPFPSGPLPMPDLPLSALIRSDRSTVQVQRSTAITEARKTVKLPEGEADRPRTFPSGELAMTCEGPIYQDSRLSVQLSARLPEGLAPRGLSFALLLDPERLSLVGPAAVDAPVRPRAGFPLVASSEGWHRVQGLAFHEGRFLARAACELFVLSKHHVGEPYVTYAEPRPSTIESRGPLHAHDLVVSLMCDRVGEDYRLSYVIVGAEGKTIVPRPLTLPSSLVSSCRRAIAGSAATPRDRRLRHLASAGEALWNALLPPDLAELLAREDGPESLLVASEDTWIPWEILRPSADALPLGARLQIGQWPATLTPRGDIEREPALAIVAPGEEPPLASIAEHAMVCHATDTAAFSLAGKPWSFLFLRGAGALDGDLPAFTGIELSDGMLQAADFSTYAGELGEGRPWCFLDILEIEGQPADSGASAWATSLLGRLGAGGIVAPRISLATEASREGWGRIDALLTSGATAGSALRELRRHAVTDPDADPTLLTFALFGDPLARAIR